MKKIWIALLTVIVLLPGCTPAKEQEAKPEPTQPPNQQPAAETKVFHISTEEISLIRVPFVLGPPHRIPTLTSKEATPEETANIIKWYNSITEYKPNTSWTEGEGNELDVNIDMYREHKGQDVLFVQIGLYGDRLLANGRDGRIYWVEQPELKEYLETVNNSY